MEEKSVSKTCAPSTFNINSFLNSTTIHVIIEVIVICGMGAFFNSKINKQASIIKELNQKIEEHESIIAKHDEILEKILNKLSGAQSIKTEQKPSRHVQATHVKTKQPEEQDVAPIGIPFNLISDMMNVATGNIQSRSPLQSKQTDILPTIEELDSEIEAELGDLKENNEE